MNSFLGRDRASADISWIEKSYLHSFLSLLDP